MVTIDPNGGHVLGNPQARIKLVEYMSYTCPHCAAFEDEGVVPLRASFVAKGQVSLEVRHFLRDPVDLAAALISNCAPPAQFLPLHEALLRAQPGWFPIMGKLDSDTAMNARWNAGDNGARMRAIAGDLHLYELAAAHGVPHASADRCLGDAALMRRITAETEAADKAGVTGTPMFTVNGTLLAGTYTWQTLQPQLQARL
jgi:protein-disulfide isomerase